MPLRSVEAATRDDAIAAAREQFGPTARVVGVRRVRSGGVLGFFATERYVAEVADPTGRPVVPTPAPSRAPETAFDETPSDYSSPLASAAPARARAAAPARNGAAAWAAEAARSSTDQPAAPPHPSPAPTRVPAAAPGEARPAAGRTTAPARSQPAAARADEERLDELAGLLAAPEAPAPARASFPRAEFQRSSTPKPRDDGPRLLQEQPGLAAGLPAPQAAAAPSPFTAALARMVAGDRDVRQAVREALDDPPAPRPRSGEAPWPTRHEAFGPEDTSVASPATRQKEETVGDQVIAPSTSADQPLDVPAWAAEPEVLAPSGSSREQAIAEVLRAALALGHSDEALAGILRKVLAGVAPQTALAEPELSVPVRAVPEVAVPPAAVPVEFPAPVLDCFAPPADVATPVAVSWTAADDIPAGASKASAGGPIEPSEPACAPVAAAPLFPAASPLPAASPTVRAEPAPLFAAPAPSPATRAPSYAAPAPFAPPPLFAPSLGSMWGDPSPAPLWGEPVTVAVSRVRQPEAPIWAEVEVPAEVPAATDTDRVDEAADAEPAPAVPDSSSTEEPATAQDVVVDEDPGSTEEPSAVDSTEVDALDVASDLPAVEEISVPDVAAETETRLDGELGAPVDDLVELHEVEQVTEVAAETAVEESAAAEAEPGTAVEAAPAVQDEVADVAEVEVEVEVEVIDEVEVEVTDEAIVEEDVAAETEAIVEEDAAAEAEAIAETEIESETEADTTVAELAPTLARTASDFAPFMSLDATTVMPPLSLLPPLPSSRGRGRPPVPPASRPLSRRAPSPAVPPSAPVPSGTAEGGTDPAEAAAAPVTTAPATRSWATVTRLPVAPLMATPETPEMPELDTDRVDEGADACLPGSDAQHAGAGDVRARLEALGLPVHLLGDSFDDDLARQGTYAALTSALARRLPVAPRLPAGAGEVLFVVGPGVETLRAARSLAATLRLDRDAVQWATRGELAGLAPKGSRMTTVETAIDRQQDAATSGSVTIVAVDAPLRTDTYWMSQMLAIWAPTAVWVVVEATRKPEDLEPWLDGLPRVDALVVTDADLSADPAAVLRRMTAPVAILDGVRATPHRWASLLCERLEKAEA